MFGKMKIKAEICNYVVYSVNKKIRKVCLYNTYKHSRKRK